MKEIAKLALYFNYTTAPKVVKFNAEIFSLCSWFVDFFNKALIFGCGKQQLAGSPNFCIAQRLIVGLMVQIDAYEQTESAPVLKCLNCWANILIVVD